MKVDLPTGADSLVMSQAAAHGFGQDVSAYLMHLINSDASESVPSNNQSARDLRSDQEPKSLSNDLKINLAPLPDSIDVKELLSRQGIQPIADFRLLRGDFFPPGETSEDFLQAIEDRKHHDKLTVE